MKIMPYIMATAFVLAATVVPAAAVEQDGRSNGATNTLGWAAIHGVPVEAMNAAEMAAVTGGHSQLFVRGKSRITNGRFKGYTHALVFLGNSAPTVIPWF